MQHNTKSINQSLYRPEQALRPLEGRGSKYFETLGTCSCEPYEAAAFTPRDNPGTHSF